MRRSLFSTMAFGLLVGACASEPAPMMPAADRMAGDPGATATTAVQAAAAAQAITAAGLLESIRVLSSDAFEGRQPGTPGEDKTVAYLTERFRAIGLAPGNPDGTYIQNVALVGIDASPQMSFSTGQTRIPLVPGTDFVAATARFAPRVQLTDSPLVFVGYGVQAPEYGWDDYKGLDVRGKTVVMLINDPPVPDPADPSRLDAHTFAGSGMTYYGRWTYKYEIAAKLGAAGAIIVHETEPAAYPWEVVRNSWHGEKFELDSPDGNVGAVAVKGWITLARARELFRAGGQDYDRQKALAARRDFHPVALAATMTATIDNKLRRVASKNVVGLLPGADPAKAGEPVIYTAHWDHFGRDRTLPGDQIFNGAVDNASGVAGLIELAKAFKALPTPPPRPVLFLSVTAEEQGLLGSRYYAQHPLYPVATTAADINMDSLNPWGPTLDIQVTGSGQNSLEDVLATAAADAGRVVIADRHPEKGGYYRSDQFEFAKVGVPGLYACRGTDLRDGGSVRGEALSDEYTREHYHKPSDEIDPRWNLEGAAQDMRLLFDVGRRVAIAPGLPEWRPTSEFRAVRVAAAGAR